MPLKVHKMKLNCLNCGKEIRKAKSQVEAGEGKYCSRSCYAQAQKGKDPFVGKVRGSKKRVRVQIDCAVCGKRFETVPSKIGVRKYCSNSCYLKDHKAKVENIKQLRDSIEYRMWRIAVYKRDYFKCQVCGSVGKDLVAHHIKPVSLNPHLVLSMDNGITLCVKCHKLVHKSYRPSSKGGEFLGTLDYETIRSQARAGMLLKVQRLGAESRTDSNAPTSAAPERDDIVRADR